MPEQSKSKPQSLEATGSALDKFLSTRISRRRVLTATAEGLTAAAIFAACSGGPKTPEEATAESLNIGSEIPPISLENLPGGEEQVFLKDARPANLVIRKGAQMAVVGKFTDSTGIDQVMFAVTDPLRKGQDGSPRAFKGIIPLLSNEQGDADKPSSFSAILSANGGSYDQQKGVVSLKDGKKGKLATTDQATVEAEKAKAGTFFVDVDPLKKDHPLLDKPVIPAPDKSILPEGGTITQLEDGRVVTKDANGALIARAITQRGLDWRWTKKEHLVNDYSPSEFADATDFKVASMLLIQDLGNPQYVENLLSLANEVKIDDLLFDRRQYKPNINLRKILDTWEFVQSEFSQGRIPYEAEVFNQTTVQQVKQLIAFKNRYKMDAIGSKLFWWSDYHESLDSNQYTPDEKKKIQEFFAVAKVLEYPEISRWVLASELAFGEVTPWVPAKAKQMLKDVGGRELVHNIATLVKQVRPDIELTLVETDMIVANNSLFKQIKQKAYDNLDYYKQRGTPIDRVSDEANYWIFDPPTENDVRGFVRNIKGRGYKVGASEMTIVESDINPWTDRPKTVASIPNKDDAQAAIARMHFRVYFEEGAECGIFSGTDADTWWIHQGYKDSLPEITDSNYSPKKAYFAIQNVLKDKSGG